MAAPDFRLDNVGPGPDPFGLADLAAAGETGVLLFQRDNYCTNCRGQVRDVASRYAEFQALEAEVVSILPEPRERVTSWQGEYDLPYPLLADPEASVGAAYEQPVRFGFLGSYSDFLGRMPLVVVLDLRADPEIAWRYAGRSTFDRPAVEDLLQRVDEVASS